MEKKKEKEKTKNQSCCGYVSNVTQTFIYLEKMLFNVTII
jgi:hypothetical protein